jgi:acyl-CoA dehydrogenase
LTGIVTEAHGDLRRGVREACADFPNEYWRALDEKREYPEAFVQAMTESGYLGALIPKEYGGMGLGLCAACAILEEVNRSGANAGPAHAQMYTMGTLLRHGSEEQKTEYLPKIASGELRLQAFGVTEPEAGTDTTRLNTSAVLTALWAFPVFWLVDTRLPVLISLALMVMIFPA